MASTLNLKERGNNLGAPLAVANESVLPTDLLWEVFLRLPADVLCRLRLVCRSWQSLTSYPAFAKAHASRHPLVAGVHFRSDEIRFMDLSGNVVKRIRVKDLSPHLCSFQLDALCISGSCPMRIPSDDENLGILIMIKSVLGHVPSTGEHKVLRIHLHRQEIDSNNCYYYQTCQVMTLGRGSNESWRVTPRTPVVVLTTPGHVAVVGGVAYFLLDIYSANDSSGIKVDDVALFDLATEEWRPATVQGPLSIPLPAGATERLICNPYSDKVRLAGLNGCLAMVPFINSRPHCSLDLWLLVDVDKGLWTKQYSMQRASPWTHYEFVRTCPLLVLDDGRIVVWEDYTNILRAYDPRTMTWVDLASIEHSISVTANVVGSLLYPAADFP